MEVKIITMTYGGYDSDDNKLPDEFCSTITDWEEMSDEQFRQLTANRWSLESLLRDKGLMTSDESIRIVTKNKISVGTVMLTISELLKLRTEKEEKDKKKREAAEKKRLEEADKKKAAKELKQLKALQAKYGVQQ